MKKLAYIIILAISLTGCKSCKKEQPQPTVYTQGGVNQNVKDYGVFKTGTYWVYQDSTSLELDSVWVYYYKETVDTADKHTANPKICPVYLYGTFSSRFRTNALFQYNTAFQYAYTPLDQVLQSVIDSANGYVGMGIFIRSTKGVLLLNQDMAFYTTSDLLNLNSIQDNYMLKNGTIKNSVLKYHHTQDWTSYYKDMSTYTLHSHETYQYLAPNIGLVKKIVIDSTQVWNLIRYNIIQ